jgi:hypothetical protein
VLEDGELSDETPLNANYNTANGRIHNDSVHGAAVYEHATPFGLWTTIASVGYSEITDIRGFLRPELTDMGDANADSQAQRRRILDGYFDTHVSFDGPFGAKMLVGADVLTGAGRQISRNGEYYVPLNGRTRAPSTTSIHVDEINTLKDTRVFAAQYVQADWTNGPVNLLVGLRLNETAEHKRSAHIDTLEPEDNEAEADHRTGAQLSGNLGLSWRFWKSGVDHAVVYFPASAVVAGTYDPSVVVYQNGAVLGGRILASQGDDFAH